jgi:hypothetical protein
MVELAWHYPWSSCRYYALGDADVLLAPYPWYDAFGATPENRQERWRAFLQTQDPLESAVRAGDCIVADADLRGASQDLRSRPMPRGRGRPTKAATG